MSESSGFFISQGGDRKYTPDWLASYIKAIITTGVFNDECGVTAADGMAVTVAPGRAWVEGYLYLLDTPKTLQISNADSILGRLDIVVLRLDLTARAIEVHVVTGTPDASPKAPALTRSSDVYELELAEISVPAGTAKITQDLIADTRLDDAVCGITVCTVQHIPTAAFLAQMQAEFAAFMQERTETFESFMQGNGSAFDGFMSGNDDTFEAFMKDGTDTLDEFMQEAKATFDTWFAALLELFDSETAGQILDVLSGHIADKNNPHNVTVEQLGAVTKADLESLENDLSQKLFTMIRALSYTKEFEAGDWIEGDDECTITIPADEHVMTGDTVSCHAFTKDAKTSEYRQNTWGAMMTYATLSENGDIVVHYPDPLGYAGKVVLSTFRHGVPITPPINLRAGQPLTDLITGKSYDVIVENGRLALMEQQ